MKIKVKLREEDIAAVSEEVNASMDQQTTLVTKVSHSSDELQNLSEELKSQLSKFKVEDIIETRYLLWITCYFYLTLL